MLAKMNYPVMWLLCIHIFPGVIPPEPPCTMSQACRIQSRIEQTNDHFGSLLDQLELCHFFYGLTCLHLHMQQSYLKESRVAHL
jgi:hypothetical protein